MRGTVLGSSRASSYTWVSDGLRYLCVFPVLLPFGETPNNPVPFSGQSFLLPVSRSEKKKKRKEKARPRELLSVLPSGQAPLQPLNRTVQSRPN